ncbi:Alkaline shock protein Asp23 [Syntrophomonas zehnderi OL-4]|uniref:Alkaline shock protein Asp23 n=1 Tax=Syntrophomonas zehnderi OL-4 TaxID=690567 RepID=A0A0E4C8H2_9FIRM|nr:Asp23/Gls24 family envelope stress response protein [Syntrophomonas zehnderi]CFX49446.1 Alkaline shock protein Asp23 [Syntrophomonas zehnderi OL-4]
MEANKPEFPNDYGVIRIADEVVSTVAGLAAIEVEGVVSLSGGWGTDLVEKLGKKNFGKGIKVEIDNNETAIDIFLIIQFGYTIPQVAETVQREVKVAVETMTGLEVTTVNVHIVSVSMKKNSGEDNNLLIEMEAE